MCIRIYIFNFKEQKNKQRKTKQKECGKKNYIGQPIIQCWLKTLSLAPEDKKDPESRKVCSDSKNIKRIRNCDDRALRYIGI